MSNLPEMLNLIEEFSVSPEISKYNLGQVSDLGNMLDEIVDKSFPEAGQIVLAGGAIRDILAGSSINDFDIFLDVSRFDKDEQDDIVLLLANKFKEDSVKLFPDFIDNYLYKLYNTEPYSNIKPSQSNTSMTTVKTLYQVDVNVIDPNAPVHDDEDNDEDDEYEEFITFSTQFIGHADESLSEDPMTFVKKFDYNLVKGALIKGEFVLSEDMLFGFKNRKIFVNDKTTEKRVSRWLKKYNFISGSHRKSFEIVKTELYKEKPAITQPISYETPIWNSNTYTPEVWPIPRI